MARDGFTFTYSWLSVSAAVTCFPTRHHFNFLHSLKISWRWGFFHIQRYNRCLMCQVFDAKLFIRWWRHLKVLLALYLQDRWVNLEKRALLITYIDLLVVMRWKSLVGCGRTVSRRRWKRQGGSEDRGRNRRNRHRVVPHISSVVSGFSQASIQGCSQLTSAPPLSQTWLEEVNINFDKVNKMPTDRCRHILRFLTQ